MKKMAPPITGPPLRISANGGMRLPNSQMTFLSPLPPPAVLAPSTIGVNGVISRTADADVNIAHHSPSLLNGNLSVQPKMDRALPGGREKSTVPVIGYKFTHDGPITWPLIFPRISGFVLTPFRHSIVRRILKYVQ